MVYVLKISVNLEVCNLFFLQKINTVYESKAMLCIMHCVAMYGDPKDEYANLNSILVLQSHFPNLNIGYSDHTIGFDAMLSAKSMGVNIFEFHFHLN